MMKDLADEDLLLVQGGTGFTAGSSDSVAPHASDIVLRVPAPDLSPPLLWQPGSAVLSVLDGGASDGSGVDPTPSAG
jgi:hypothetical protein